jgi:type VI secretion system secreted protein VgrG
MATVLGYSQAAHDLKIDTELGPDKLLLRALSGQETISQPYRFQLDLLSEDDSINFDSIVGTTVTLRLATIDGARFFHGYINRFSLGAQDGRFTNYRAEVVPWLWFLTLTSDCRIFQNKSAPEIVQLIFKDLNFTDYILKLYRNYRTRDYCVQYRESDFNFVSRLLEEEGIYYFFRHEQGKHTMILIDDASAQESCLGQATATCEVTDGGWIPDDTITEIRLEEEFLPSSWAHTDYNFETPGISLMLALQQHPKWEIYDYPGVYSKRGDGDRLATTRLEEITTFRQRANGKSNCRGFDAGFTVEIRDHYRSDVNQKWLLTAVRHDASVGGSYATGSEKKQEGHYANTFECIPASTLFRPSRRTPKPRVQGCQTAVVVGPEGEEIYTDKYGRVKVQFHWDREGRRNENTSCWIRVSYPWAGKGWGGIHIPRIGHEVVVDFLEGDPDQPIIIGRVYHAENMPPWKLPAKAVISGFKSQSTKGGHGYNELSMDDTKGNELIRVHAQCDQDICVGHDERTNVGHDRTEGVGRDETISIGRDRAEIVGQDETTTIGRDRTELVSENETITIGKNRTEVVGGSEGIMIGIDRTESVTVNENVTVGMMRTHKVGVNDMLNVGMAQETVIGGAQTITVGLARAISVGMSQTTEVGKSYTLNAADSIVLKTGDSSLTMNSDGTIEIKGKLLTLSGDTSHLYGKKLVTVTSMEQVTVAGGMIDLNPA